MMDRSQPEDQDRIARLISLGYPPDGRLDPHLKAGAYGRLASRLAQRPAFPIAVLAILCAGLLGLEVLVFPALTGSFSLPDNPLITFLLGSVLILNLINLPVAGIILVIRRNNAKLDV